MPTNYFLLKSEPETYSFADLERDKKTAWDGVRNHTAKLQLLKMKVGDQAFIYHSGDDKKVVGIAECTGAARPDPSDETGKFVCVDLKVGRRLKRPVTLAEFKAAGWDQFDLVRMSRLSCMEVPPDVRDWILATEATPAGAPVAKAPPQAMKPAAAKPATKKPTAKKPAAAKPAAAKPAAKKPAAAKPAAKKKPATKKPATKKPAAKKPAAQEA